MRRSIFVAALLLTATFAAPAAANPIAFVSGPSPVAIVSGILTVNGPEVNAGQFVLEATNGSFFSGNWPSFGHSTASSGLPSGRFTGTFSPAPVSSPGQGPASAPAAPSIPAPPLQFIGEFFGLPTLENAQVVFITAVIFSVVPALVPANGLGAIPAGATDGLNGANVPEPGTILLISSGLVGIAVARRRRRKNSARP